MELGRFLCLFLVCLTCFVSATEGYKFYVGGRDGWVLKPSESYNHWAERNRFLVNDTLYFKYNKGSDSVLVVNKDSFYNCNTSNPIHKLDDGNSEFKFDRSGPFYFISGQDGNCAKGQKLIIIVLAVRHRQTPPAQPPTAAPPQGSAPAPVPSKGSAPAAAPSGPASTPSYAPSTTPITTPVPAPSKGSAPAAAPSGPSSSPSYAPSTTPITTPVPGPSKGSAPAAAPSGPSSSPSLAPSTTPITSPVPAPAAATTPTSSPPSPVGPEPTPSGAAPSGEVTSPPPGSNQASTAPNQNGAYGVTASSVLVSSVVVLVSLALMSSFY
ncbi:early nodulin-like protein 2 [Rosa chinensis]|uniref:early nodulin-like protein 2 n=1 Tax=Rosa chinensis TaxID=74649 RepID=UPI000D08A675|nr:early nodulin-like protein 2 [Rosa chinensis]